MPDGDIVHDQLAWRYQKPYKWLCEGTASISECSWAVMKALKEEIKQKGDLPVALAQQMGEKLSHIFSCHLDKSSIDWAATNMEFDRLSQQIKTSHYHKELVLNAGKSIVNDLRYRRIENIDNFSESILKYYFFKVYKSSFKERIPLILKHYFGVNEITLEKRIQEIEPDILAVANTWAKKADTDGSVAKLRLPPRRQVKKVDLDEDLLGG